VSSVGGVRLRLAALGFPWGARKGMQALYTNRWVQRLPQVDKPRANREYNA
jgi:hypothetical protein